MTSISQIIPTCDGCDLRDNKITALEEKLRDIANTLKGGRCDCDTEVGYICKSCTAEEIAIKAMEAK